MGAMDEQPQPERPRPPSQQEIAAQVGQQESNQLAGGPGPILRVVRGQILRDMTKIDLLALHSQLLAELPSGDLDVLHNSSHAAMVGELDWIEAEIWTRER